MQEIHAEYSSRVDFLTIYIKEAHPEDEWQLATNEKEGICYAQPKDLEARLAIVRDFKERFAYEIPLVLDTMENRADEIYAAWPERLYIITEERQIAYKGRMGPMGFDPEEVERWLKEQYD